MSLSRRKYNPGKREREARKRRRRGGIYDPAAARGLLKLGPTAESMMAMSAISILREEFVERAGRCSSCGSLRVTEELAAEIGVSRTTLWRFVQGRSDGDPTTRDKIREWMATR